jgi:ABC-type sugar transport system ATPase subunit
MSTERETSAVQHVELQNITKRYGGFEAVKDLSLSIEKGEFCALLGPSGCGKSTLLRMIAGLEEVTEGKILINGADVTDLPPAKRRIAMVFQSYALYPHLTVRQNIGFSLSVAHAPKEEIERRTGETAKMLQLEQLLDRRPAQLSGGQRQRVAIGRALVRDPEVFLFDEPLSNLDALLRVQMRIELAKLHKSLGTTMVYVTHDQVEAMTLADKIVVLDNGRIAQTGSPLELYNSPANRFVASFIGSPAMNFFDAEARFGDGQNASVRIKESPQMRIATRFSAAPRGKDGFEIGIRPEHVSLLPPGGEGADLHGTVSIVEQLGNSTVIYIDTDAGQVVAESHGKDQTRSGDRVALKFDQANIHLFDAGGAAI